MPSLLEKRKHGIDMPEWMWAMMEDARKVCGNASKTAWLWSAIIEKAKRDKVYNGYKKRLKEVGGRLI